METKSYRFIVNRKYCIFLSKLLFYVFHFSRRLLPFVVVISSLVTTKHHPRPVSEWRRVPAMKTESKSTLWCIFLCSFSIPSLHPTNPEKMYPQQRTEKSFFYSSLVGQLLGVLSTLNVNTRTEHTTAVVVDFTIPSLLLLSGAPAKNQPTV